MCCVVKNKSNHVWDISAVPNAGDREDARYTRTKHRALGCDGVGSQ